MNITEYRKSLNVSQYKLSLVSGISRHRISNHELNYVKLTHEELFRAEKALNKIKADKAKLKGGLDVNQQRN